MTSLNELVVRGQATQISRLWLELDHPVLGGWCVNSEAEARLKDWGLDNRGMRCFRCTAEGSRPAAALWLQKRGDTELYVPNIVPLGKRELNQDEYNSVLADFHEQVLRPATDGLGLEITMAYHRATPEAFLSPEAARRLRAFTNARNHPFTQGDACKKWREFIVQTYVDGTYLAPELLDQWFFAEGLPEEERICLLSEYETSRSLLGTYDEERLEKCLP